MVRSFVYLPYFVDYRLKGYIRCKGHSANSIINAPIFSGRYGSSYVYRSLLKSNKTLPEGQRKPQRRAEGHFAPG